MRIKLGLLGTVKQAYFSIQFLLQSNAYLSIVYAIFSMLKSENANFSAPNKLSYDNHGNGVVHTI